MFKITLNGELVVEREFENVDAAITFLNERNLSATTALIEHKLTGYSVRVDKTDRWTITERR